MAPVVGFMPLRETPGSLLSLFLSLSPSGKQKKMSCEHMAAEEAKRRELRKNPTLLAPCSWTSQPPEVRNKFLLFKSSCVLYFIRAT